MPCRAVFVFGGLGTIGISHQPEKEFEPGKLGNPEAPDLTRTDSGVSVEWHVDLE
jgi:hypothetical protein